MSLTLLEGISFQYQDKDNNNNYNIEHLNERVQVEAISFNGSIQAVT